MEQATAPRLRIATWPLRLPEAAPQLAKKPNWLARHAPADEMPSLAECAEPGRNQLLATAANTKVQNVTTRHISDLRRATNEDEKERKSLNRQISGPPYLRANIQAELQTFFGVRWLCMGKVRVSRWLAHFAMDAGVDDHDARESNCFAAPRGMNHRVRHYRHLGHKRRERSRNRVTQAEVK
jgi:hypothetical protein